MNKFNLIPYQNKKAFVYSLLSPHLICCRTKVTKFSFIKRGLLLENMITDRDKRKNWHFNINADKSKCRNVFENLHKPSRRRGVLNSLFIKNITDVISTGEMAPEVMGHGIEISGVKISPCYKILNVFWQIPDKYYDSSEDISKALNMAAPKIRAELISRNVMGHVPFIYFLRDGTNSRIAAFDLAMKKLDLPPDAESGLVPDDSFTKDIYTFKSSRFKKEDTVAKAEEDDTVAKSEEVKAPLGIPQKPLDMKSNIFGLNHDVMMEKVLTFKSKAKQPQPSAVISPHIDGEDLFNKIPGICFQTDTTRDQILKKFQIERKMLMQRKTQFKLSKEDYRNHEEAENAADYSEVPEDNSFLEDFVEEDAAENSRL